MNLTDERRTSALIALLDDVIKKDEERAPGEWHVDDCETVLSDTYPRLVADCAFPHAFTDPKQENRNASFIAGASVSHGLNAGALKDEIEWLQRQIADVPQTTAQHGWKFRFESRLTAILSLYPDDLLKKYLK